MRFAWFGPDGVWKVTRGQTLPFAGLASFQAVIRRCVAAIDHFKEQKLAECSAAACKPRECEVFVLNNLNEQIGGVLPRQDQTSRYDELR